MSGTASRISPPYDQFTIRAGRVGVLKPNGTLWVIGTYHNIHRVGGHCKTWIFDLELIVDQR
jgi:hypothetical protein